MDSLFTTAEHHRWSVLADEQEKYACNSKSYFLVIGHHQECASVLGNEGLPGLEAIEGLAYLGALLCLLSCYKKQPCISRHSCWGGSLHWNLKIWKDILESDVFFLGNLMRPTFFSLFVSGYRENLLWINEILILIRILNFIRWYI